MKNGDVDNILLNLTTTRIEKPHSVRHKKIKARQRDVSLKLKQRQNKAGTHQSKTAKSKVSKSENLEKHQVISSLFRKNPELPDISSAVVQAEASKEDETFSENDFHNMNLAPHMISNLEKNLHLKKMTRVQRDSLPLLLHGKDVFINSPTGTGKTLSYVIPIVQSLQKIVPKIKRVDGPYCLILVPTRELASQTFTVLQRVLKPFIWIVPGCITGGEKRKAEKARLKKGLNILVATPGRLVDHLKMTVCLTMSKLRWLVLDEADRLLDDGFQQDLSFILSTIQQQTWCSKVQKVLLSATLSKGVENLVDVNMENPVTIRMIDERRVDCEVLDKMCNSVVALFHAPDISQSSTASTQDELSKQEKAST